MATPLGRCYVDLSLHDIFLVGAALDPTTSLPSSTTTSWLPNLLVGHQLPGRDMAGQTAWIDSARKARFQDEKMEPHKGKLLVPELAARLTGGAWTVTPELDNAKFSSRSGVKYFLEFLRPRLCRAAVPWMGGQRPYRSQSPCLLSPGGRVRRNPTTSSPTHGRLKVEPGQTHQRAQGDGDQSDAMARLDFLVHPLDA